VADISPEWSRPLVFLFESMPNQLATKQAIKQGFNQEFSFDACTEPVFQLAHQQLALSTSGHWSALVNSLLSNFAFTFSPLGRARPDLIGIVYVSNDGATQMTWHKVTMRHQDTEQMVEEMLAETVARQKHIGTTFQLRRLRDVSLTGSLFVVSNPRYVRYAPSFV